MAKTTRSYVGLTKADIEAKKAVAATAKAATQAKATTVSTTKVRKSKNKKSQKDFTAVRSRDASGRYAKHNRRAAIKIIGGH